MVVFLFLFLFSQQLVSYLMRTLGLPLVEALELVRKSRPQVCPNANFLDQLRFYERQLFAAGVLIDHHQQQQLQQPLDKEEEEEEGYDDDDQCQWHHSGGGGEEPS